MTAERATPHSIRRVVVPLDGSAFAERALPSAVALAREAGAELHVVQVRTLLGGGPEASTGAASIEEAIESYLQAVARRLEAELGRPVVHALLRDRAAERAYGSPSRHAIAHLISAYARERDADLIALTTHGRGGFNRAWLGSVADALIRQSPRPLLLLRPRDDDPAPLPPFRSVLVALDASPVAPAVVPAALGLAAPAATVTLLRVLAPVYANGRDYMPGRMNTEGPAVDASKKLALEDLERLAATVDVGSVRLRLATPVAWEPARAVLDTATAEGTELIALTAHARRGVARSVVGSVADKVLRAAECPVLVLNPEHPGADGAA